MGIRMARMEDLPAVAEIFNHEIRTGVNAFDTEPLDEEQQHSWFDSHQTPKYPLIVADESRTVLGWANLSPWGRQGAYARTAEVAVFVDKDNRGRGIGKALLETLILHARQVGHRVLVAKVESNNEPSLRLHYSAGFTRVGTMHRVGEKFNRLLDVEILELQLKPVHGKQS